MGTDRRAHRIGAIALAAAVSVMATSCAGTTPQASTAVGASFAAASATPVPATPTAAQTASPIQTPTSTPVPSLPSTTVAAASAPPGAIAIKMGWGSLRYDPTQITAKAGKVVFFLQMDPNGSLTGHNVVIGPRLYQVTARSEIVQPKRSAVFTVEGLTPGSYTFWCEVPGHAKEGMVGQLTIAP